jgi:hypothetical protein
MLDQEGVFVINFEARFEEEPRYSDHGYKVNEV